MRAYRMAQRLVVRPFGVTFFLLRNHWANFNKLGRKHAWEWGYKFVRIKFLG